MAFWKLGRYSDRSAKSPYKVEALSVFRNLLRKAHPTNKRTENQDSEGRRKRLGKHRVIKHIKHLPERKSTSLEKQNVANAYSRENTCKFALWPVIFLLDII